MYHEVSTELKAGTWRQELKQRAWRDKLTGYLPYTTWSRGSTFLRCIHTFCLFVFRDRVSLCSPSYPGTHSVGQAGLELRNLSASASQVLGLKACTTMPCSTYTLAGQLCLDSPSLRFSFQVTLDWVMLTIKNDHRGDLKVFVCF